MPSTDLYSVTGTNYLTIVSAGGSNSGVRVWVVNPVAQTHTELVEKAAPSVVEKPPDPQVEVEGRQSYNISDFTEFSYNEGRKLVSLRKRFSGANGTGRQISTIVIQCSTDGVGSFYYFLKDF